MKMDKTFNSSDIEDIIETICVVAKNDYDFVEEERTDNTYDEVKLLVATDEMFRNKEVVSIVMKPVKFSIKEEE